MTALAAPTLWDVGVLRRRRSRDLSPKERTILGRLIWAFIRAGWNPPPPDDEQAARLIEDVRDAHPLASLDLSPREYDVLRGLADGLTYGEIGERLGVSRETVKDSAAEVYRQLGVRNAAEAVKVGVQRGLIE